jgi:hypothetical protein
MYTTNTTKKSTTISPNLNPNNPTSFNKPTTSTIQPFKKETTAEEEYITNLQKQIYYLELEMKLMKDRELETKNKVGGYEILFRDGVPLNEHFLALKTKYTNEKEQFDRIINDLNSEINNIENENRYIAGEIEESNRNYYSFAEKYSNNSEYYSNKIFEINSKLINEENTKESHLANKQILNNSLTKFTSANFTLNRKIEKEELFKEINKNDKNNNLEKNMKELAFNENERHVVNAQLQEDSMLKEILNNVRQKKIENENEGLIYTLNKLEREMHMGKAKQTELKNLLNLNKKYLTDEELNKRNYLNENKKLTSQMDQLTNINEDHLKVKIKEAENSKVIVIKNSINSQSSKLNYLIDNLNNEESTARELLDNRSVLLQKIKNLDEEYEEQKNAEIEMTREIIDLKNAIQEYEILIEEDTNSLNNLLEDSNRLNTSNEKYENDIKIYNKKIDEILQKIELNSILKDIDIYELKNLIQNNSLVNHSLNNLMSKWDKAYSKLNDIEENEKKNNLK